jgi:hypothetical protein
MAQNGSETLLVREFRAINDEKQPESLHLTAKLAVKMVSLLKKSELFYPRYKSKRFLLEIGWF